MSSAKALPPPERLLPIRYAESFTGGSLYWLPVDSFPMRKGERQRNLALVTGLVQALEKSLKAQAACFWSQEAMSPSTPDLRDRFFDDLYRLQPASGYQRRAGQVMQMLDGDTLVKEVQALTGPLDVSKYQHFLSYWCTAAEPAYFIENYFGYSYATVLLLAAVPGVAPVKIPAFLMNHPGFKPLMDDSPPEAIAKKVTAASHPFRQQSRELFGTGFARPSYVKSMPFILPDLVASDFFAQGSKLTEALFQLAPVYIRESKVDQGILVASKEPLHDLFIDLLTMLATKPNTEPNLGPEVGRRQ